MNQWIEQAAGNFRLFRFSKPLSRRQFGREVVREAESSHFELTAGRS
jgi:hypothetical protein